MWSTLQGGHDVLLTPQIETAQSSNSLPRALNGGIQGQYRQEIQQSQRNDFPGKKSNNTPKKIKEHKGLHSAFSTPRSRCSPPTCCQTAERLNAEWHQTQHNPVHTPVGLTNIPAQVIDTRANSSPQLGVLQESHCIAASSAELTALIVAPAMRVRGIHQHLEWDVLCHCPLYWRSTVETLVQQFHRYCIMH